MMKDPFIEEKLNHYAETVKPPAPAVLAAAVRELRRRNESARFAAPKKKGFGGVAVRLAAAAAVAVLLSVVSVWAYFSFFTDSGTPGSDSGKPGTYRLSDLTPRAEDIREIERRGALIITGENAEAKALLYYEPDAAEPAVLAVRYKVSGADGLDEITVYTDLKGGLADYAGFRDFAVYADRNGVTVAGARRYENGEYYTDLYFRFNGADYYILAESAGSASADEYLARLLG